MSAQDAYMGSDLPSSIAVIGNMTADAQAQVPTPAQAQQQAQAHMQLQSQVQQQPPSAQQLAQAQSQAQPQPQPQSQTPAQSQPQTPATPHASKRRKGLVSSVVNSLIIVVIVAVALLMALTLVTQSGGSLAGVRSYIIATGSMTPAINEGSYLFVQEKPAENIQVGDVITYHVAQDTAYLTHRVIEVQGSGAQLRFITQGDANNTPDTNPVAPESVVGAAVMAIPYLGGLLLGLRNPVNLALAAGTLVVIFLAPELYRRLAGVPREPREPREPKKAKPAQRKPAHEKNTSAPLALVILVASLLSFAAMLASPATAALAADSFESELEGNHIYITGDSQNFALAAGGNKLFDISAMLPGESTQLSTITITNAQSLPFTISIGVRDNNSNSALLNALDAKVYLNGQLLSRFPAKGQASGANFANAYPIGVIPAGTTTNIQVGFAFAQGAAASNALQNKKAELEWIITAVSDQPTVPDTPTTPQPPNNYPPTTPTAPTAPTTSTTGTTGTTGTAGAGTGAGTTQQEQQPTDSTATPSSSSNLPMLENIPEAQTPEASGAPQAASASWAVLNLVLTVLTFVFVAASLFCWVAARKQRSNSATTPQEQNTQARRRRWALSVTVAAVAAVACVVFFAITENTQLPMELVNIRTLYYVVANVVAMAFLAVALLRGNGGALAAIER